MSLREKYEPRIRQALEDIKEALARKEVVCDTLTAIEVPDKIREIQLNKYTLTLTCSEFTGGTVTASLDGTIRTATVNEGKAALKLPKAGKWHVEHDLGDYVEVTIQDGTFENSAELVKKKVVFSEGECSEEKITVHIDSITGNNSKPNTIRVKKNGVVISATPQLSGSDINITGFEYEEGATYTIEYVLSEEVRGSIEIIADFAKYALTINATEFENDSLTVSKGGDSKTCSVKSGTATVKLKTSGTWRVQGTLGDYVDVEIGETEYNKSATLVKKRVTLSEGECSKDKIVVHIDSTTGNNLKPNVIRVKKNGSIISANVQTSGSDLNITEFEFENGAIYTIEYVLGEEVRGSIEVQIIVYGESAKLKEEFLAEGIDEIADKTTCTGITSIVFTDEKAPSDVTTYDKSANGDRSVVAWVKDGTLTVSSQVKYARIELFGTTPTDDSSYYTVFYAYDRNVGDYGTSYDFDDVERIDLGNVDTSKVKNMKNYFGSLDKLQKIENLDKLETGLVEDMQEMFGKCDISDLDLSHFDTSKVKTMRSMFHNCNKLSKINLANFNTEAVTDMSFMFARSKVPNLDLSSFTANQAINCYEMFYSCDSLEVIDLSNFTIPGNSRTAEMFSTCSTLKTIYAPEWNSVSVSDSKDMFKDCDKLPNYNWRYATIARAKWKENGGYFTNPAEKPS